ncbi:MAG: T9SS type A sorting domain-containing protein [Ignavibacteria bacterium]|nr:T9SS type A sorting domain-containing protein [Ignavibacteria bacterium]
MKTKINIIFILVISIVILISTSRIIYSQFDNIGQECGTISSGSLVNIPVKTPGTSDFLRCLIVYITFPDDSTSGFDYTIWEKPTITPNSKPINPYSGTSGRLTDSLVGNPNDPFMTRYSNYTLSDFYCEMSMGQYDVIGDEISITLPLNSTQYRDAGYNRGSMNRYILNYLDSTRTIDWSRYDNWSYNNGWEFEPDGTAEMIIMNYRTIPNNSNSWFWSSGWGGEASLAISPITFDSITIGYHNGITSLNLLHATGRSEILLEHEFSHKIFGGGIPKTGEHINMGFMTPGHNETSYLFTPMERSAPVVDYVPINLINSTGIYTDTLPDFVESGVSFKIKIPGTTDDHIWIANHQKKSLYDGIARGGTNCYSLNFAEIDPFCSDGKGLFIYREGTNCSNINQPYDIISAEGKFNWDVDRNVSVPAQNYHHSLGFSMPILKTEIGKRYSGRDKYNKHPASPISNFGTWITDDICSDDLNDFNISLSFRGDNFDPFNIGYEEIFSPYSNPSSSFCDSGNFGITIALMEQESSSGDIIVKIYYNNDEDALFDLPPSKPKNLKVGKQYFGEPESYKFYPVVTWDSNIEPDFYDAPAVSPLLITPVYEIYRADTTVCDIEPVYSLITTVSSTTTQYVDYNVTLYDNMQDVPEYCEYPLLTYSYKILAKDNRGNRSLKSERGLVTGYYLDCGEESEDIIVTENNILPDKFSITNYPNPFNPVTNIKFDLPKDVQVSIKIYDMVGREVKTLVNEYKTAGRYSVTFSGSDFASGVYYYKIKAGEFEQVRKMILLK